MDICSGFSLQGYMKAKRKGQGHRIISPFVVLQIFFVFSAFYLKMQMFTKPHKIYVSKYLLGTADN